MARYCTDCGHELGRMKPSHSKSTAQVIDPELETYVDPDPVVEPYEEKGRASHEEDQLKRRDEGNNGWGGFSFDKFDK
jgi:hypothetical protein